MIEYTTKIICDRCKSETITKASNSIAYPSDYEGLHVVLTLDNKVDALFSRRYHLCPKCFHHAIDYFINGTVLNN